MIVFNMQQKLINIIKLPKQHILNESFVVYKIFCANCNRSYVGHTNRGVTERRNEHLRLVKKRDKSSAEHSDKIHNKI